MNLIEVKIDDVIYQDVGGLQDATLNIVRDESVKGLLITYLSDIKFYNAAYDAILDFVNTNGSCSQIPVSIYYGDQNADGFAFDGYIVFEDPDTQINDTECSITAKVQQGNLSNFILDKLDFAIPINAPTCIDGTTPLTAITDRQCQYFDINGYTGTAYETYLVKDVLGQCLEYLSNGVMSLNAPIFDVPFLEDIYDINYNTWVAGETMTIEWTNFYGQTWSSSQLFTASEPTSNGQLLARSIHEANTLVQVRNNYLQKFSYQIAGVPPVIDDGILASYLPFSDVTISVSPARVGPDPVITKTQTWQFGLEDLGITRRSILQDDVAEFRVTLGEMLRHLADVFNLTFSFETNTSGLQMVLKPTDEYFDNTEALDLGNPREVVSNFSDEFAASQINTPKGITDTIFTTSSWLTDNCIGQKIESDAAGFSSQDFFNALSGTDKDDLLMWSMLDFSVSNLARLFSLDFATGVSSIGTRRTYNAPYISAIRCYNYFINSNKDYTQVIKVPLQTLASCTANCDIGTITNTNNLLINKKYTFKSCLSVDNQRQLIENSTQFIKFSVYGNNYDGFINDISIRLYNGETEFNLLSESIT